MYVKFICVSGQHICFHKTHDLNLVYQMFMNFAPRILRSGWWKSFCKNQCKINPFMVWNLENWMNELLYHQNTVIYMKIWYTFRSFLELFLVRYYFFKTSRKLSWFIMNISVYKVEIHWHNINVFIFRFKNMCPPQKSNLMFDISLK